MKSTKSYPGLIATLLLITLSIINNISIAETGLHNLVEESVKTLVSINRPTSLIDNQRELTKLAKAEPFVSGDAAIVFNRPKSSSELLDWAKKNNLTLINLEAKFPIRDLVFKARFEDMESLSGTLEDKLDYLERRHQESIEDIIDEKELKLARKNLSDQARASSARALNDYKKLKKMPINYLQVEVVGNYQRLGALGEDSDTRIVLLQENKSASRNMYKGLKKRDLKDSGPLIDAVRMNNKSDNSDSSFLDILLSMPDNFRYKMSDSLKILLTASSRAVAAPSICGGAAAPEMNCPGDRYWLPPKSDAEMSVLIYVYGGETPWMEGYFYSTFEWDTGIDPAYNLKRNTMSFKAMNAPHCNPEIIGVSAPCGGNVPQEDVTYVPQSTYEHEGIIENWSCSLTRTGSHIDRFYNCLTPSYALSVLPSWYYDTTFGDDWHDLNASIGSLAPETILEGEEYYTYVYFWAYGNENFTGRKVTMSGQIGTEYPFPVAPSFRVFSVDSTKIDDDYLIPLLFP